MNKAVKKIKKIKADIDNLEAKEEILLEKLDEAIEELEKRMKEIIDQYAPILEGKVDVADIKKKQKQLRLNGRSQPLQPLKKVKPIEESLSKDKNKLIEPQSSSQKTDDQDSTS